MIVTVIIIAAIVYLAFHLGAGHTHHPLPQSPRPAPQLYWSSVRGRYASVRLPGGFRVGHRL